MARTLNAILAGIVVVLALAPLRPAAAQTSKAKSATLPAIRPGTNTSPPTLSFFSSRRAECQ